MNQPLALSSFLFLQVSFRGEVWGTTPPPFRRIDVIPSADYPLGRKGLLLASSWRQMKESHTRGMCILDADVAIDPIDFDAMYRAMKLDNKSIWTAPARIWPKSTGYPSWVWAHRKFGTLPSTWQSDSSNVDTGSFCFTYLPSRLMEACISGGLKDWVYPNVDCTVYEIARKLEIPVKVVRDGCAPKHMNY